MSKNTNWCVHVSAFYCLRLCRRDVPRIAVSGMRTTTCHLMVLRTINLFADIHTKNICVLVNEENETNLAVFSTHMHRPVRLYVLLTYNQCGLPFSPRTQFLYLHLHICSPPFCNRHVCWIFWNCNLKGCGRTYCGGTSCCTYSCAYSQHTWKAVVFMDCLLCFVWDPVHIRMDLSSYAISKTSDTHTHTHSCMLSSCAYGFGHRNVHALKSSCYLLLNTRSSCFPVWLSCLTFIHTLRVRGCAYAYTHNHTHIYWLCRTMLPVFHTHSSLPCRFGKNFLRKLKRRAGSCRRGMLIHPDLVVHS